MDKKQDKWYFKSRSLVVSFLFVGPFMLPLVWFNPGFSKKKKVIVTIAVIILTCILTVILLKSLKNLDNCCQFLQNEIY